MKNRKAVKAYLDAYKELFADGQIGLMDIIKTCAKLSLLARDLKKEEREFVAKEIDNFL